MAGWAAARRSAASTRPSSSEWVSSRRACERRHQLLIDPARARQRRSCERCLWGDSWYTHLVRYLCLSDIHGHADALSAVLATAERSGYDKVIVAGDICFPGPAPLRTWQRLQQLQAICVQGVSDRAIATVETQVLRPRDAFERERLQRLLDVRAELGERILHKLVQLPQVYRRPLAGAGELLVVHGCPADPLEGMTHDMDDAELAAALATDPSHVRGVRRLPRAFLADHSAAAPRGRISSRNHDSGPWFGWRGAAAGGRFAHAAFVEAGDSGIEVEQFVVPLGRAA